MEYHLPDHLFRCGPMLTDFWRRFRCFLCHASATAPLSPHGGDGTVSEVPPLASRTAALPWARGGGLPEAGGPQADALRVTLCSV